LIFNKKSFIFGKRFSLQFDYLPNYLLDLELNVMYFKGEKRDFTINDEMVYGKKDENHNYYVPLHCHIEYSKNIIFFYKNLLTYNSDNFDKYVYYDYLYFKVFMEIEKSGLYIDKSFFYYYFVYNRITNLKGLNIKNDLIYNQYNLYNRTGRPSNSFDSINYMALKKNNGERKVFQSRFKDRGYIVEFDFESYHPRLLSNLLDSSFGRNINFYQLLGSILTNKNYEDITQEEIEYYKSKSFYYLYGNTPSGNKMDFLEKINNFKDYLLNKYKKNGYILSYYFKRPIFVNSFKKGVILNYFAQSFETENNIIKIYKILKYLEKNNLKSKIILYQYDSIVIDFCLDDGMDFLKNVKYILERQNQKIKLQVGKNFNKMFNLKK
jgi:hypothetical protein